MKLLLASLAIVASTAASAVAADPIGDWMVKDGYGVIRIDNCNGKMWGIVAWEKAAGVDKENPDPAKRARPTLGVPILLGMAPTQPNKWEGEIYNTENGKTYSGNISMVDEGTLALEGCLFTNFLCGGQKWTRVTTLPSTGVSLQSSQAKAQTKAPSKQATQAAPSEVCTRVAAETGQPATGQPAAKGSAKK